MRICAAAAGGVADRRFARMTTVVLDRATALGCLIAVG